MNADEIIRRLQLIPHPEGGHYRETYRHSPADGGRGDATQIYYLLRGGERSHWHRVDAIEIWHWYAGAPLRLEVAADGEAPLAVILGNDFAAGQAAHYTLPPFAWQAAESQGAWTLAGCTVAPAFQFEGFEMAPPGWSPDD
ncbi:cupin domain-containing protein [Defluviicoccus vanus]|uniref:Cupin domain-containing protein n=1 Tax=Defluviicoccus vanus TaxID=111831 RepID=A0A7H1N5P0_9PROT|nr:cupin domain-containing protein [Defluviicoccus vanus]QNT71026.1 cupin domain-containing protein [Defluviicoccus vanus]